MICIPRKITNILEVMKLADHVEDFAPEADRIHLSNGTLMPDGSFAGGQTEHCAEQTAGGISS